MFRKSYLASAVVVAMLSQGAYAAEENTADDSDIEIIQVRGIKGSLNKGLSIKRENFQLVDAIVAEDIGKFPDNNVVEALQRVTGVQVTDRAGGEASSVSIRGLSDVTTTVNGRNIFTAASRQVALADIPASLLRQVDVYKTRSASQIEAGIAGSIDIKTQRPFHFEDSKVVVAARGIYQEQAEKVDPNVSLLLSDRWDLGSAGEFGALVNVSYAETNFRDQSATSGAMVPFLNGEVAEGMTFPYERMFSGWQAGMEAGMPSHAGATHDFNGDGVESEYILGRDAIFMSNVVGKRERPAANLSLQWAPSDTLEFVAEAFYNGFRNNSFNSLNFNFVDAWWTGEIPEPVLFEGTNIVKSRHVIGQAGFTSGDMSTGKTDTYLYAIGANWYVTDNLNLKADLSFQDSTYEDTFNAMRFDLTAAYEMDVDHNSGDGIISSVILDNPETDIDESDLTDTALWNSGTYYDNASKSEGDALSFTLDGERLIDGDFIDTVKFGLRYDKRSAVSYSRLNASNDQLQDSSTGQKDGMVRSHEVFEPYEYFDDELQHVTTGFFDGKATVPTEWVVANGDYLLNGAKALRPIYNMDLNPQLNKNFDVEETNTALYLQTNFRVGDDFTGEAGLRYVTVDSDMSFFERSFEGYDEATETAGAGWVGSQSSASNSVTKLLPSVVLRYNLLDDLIARFAYTQTLRMPNFDQLNSFVTYNDDVTGIGYGTASGGNPKLAPTESTNYDLSLEWYFGDSSSLYGTVFKRDIEGFVVDYRKSVYHAKPGQDEELYILSAPQNASDGALKGFELGLVYFPENLPDWLDGLGVQASYTKLDSEQTIPNTNEAGEVVSITKSDLYGVSDSSYSAVLAYEREAFGMRLSYSWREAWQNERSDALFANPMPIWRRPESSLDFQLSYDVTNNLSVTLDATNLTDELNQNYYGEGNQETHAMGSWIISRTVALGVRYSM